MEDLNLVISASLYRSVWPVNRQSAL